MSDGTRSILKTVIIAAAIIIASLILAAAIRYCGEAINAGLFAIAGK